MQYIKRVRRLDEAILPQAKMCYNATLQPASFTMNSQLLTYLRTNGSEFKVGHREFTYLRMFSVGTAMYGDVQLGDQVYDLKFRPRAQVKDYAGAEVWLIRGRYDRPIAQFAMHEGKILELAYSVEPLFLDSSPWILSVVPPPKKWKLMSENDV